jgi:hypothetical protein
MSDEDKKQPTTQEIINSIKDTPEMAALLNASNESHFKLKEDELGGKYMGKAYNSVDNALMETLGIKDRPSGKTTELVTNIAKENKELKKQLESLNNTEITKPKEDNTAKEELYNAQLSELQKQIAELNQTNIDLTTNSRNKEVSSKLRNAASKLTFNAAYSSSLLDETLENRISKAVTNSKEIDGQTIYYNSNQDPYMELGKPMDASKVANELFKDLIQVKTAGGAASNDSKPHVKGDIVVLPNHQNITTFSQFNKEFEKAMRTKGLTRKDDKYYELQRNTRDHYKFKGLPSE